MSTWLQLGILCGRPFTADIAKETVPEQFWAMPGFRRTTYMLSWLWAAIFLIMTLSYVVSPLCPAASVPSHKHPSDLSSNSVCKTTARLGPNQKRNNSGVRPLTKQHVHRPYEYPIYHHHKQP